MLSEKTLRRLKELKAKRIMVQIPEGLKTRALEIGDFLESKGFDAVLSVEPCFGACDLRDHEAAMLGCDSLLHIGHTDFGLTSKVPVVYEEWPSDFDPVIVLREHTREMDRYKNVGLLATAQHLASLGKVRKFLERDGKTVLVGKGSKVEEGQVLGCNYSSANIVEKGADCFIFIGSGNFHLTGLAKRTGKTIFFVDADNGKFSRFSIDVKKEELKRQLRIEKARHLHNFGIYVSTKPGQTDMSAAVKAKLHLEKRGKKAIIISADMLTAEKIMGIGIEALVNTACPRIYEDQKMLRIPVLNPREVKEI
jgi:2-(3-amino-3-carboxypropyl)histidine synthase